MKKKEWVQIMLRLEPDDAKNLSDTAYASGLQVGVYAREILLGRVPEALPPAPSEVTFEAQALLQICHAVVSNLQQLSGHATRIGEPFSKLEVPLETLRDAARKIGLDVKSGNIDNDQASHLLNQLQAPSLGLNDLAKSLNIGQHESGTSWHQVLTALQNGLSTSVSEMAVAA